MLDTNTCSFVIREKPPDVLQTLVQKVNAGHQIVISAITYLEMRYGAIGKKASPKHTTLVSMFIERVDAVLPFDREAVDRAADVKKHLSDRGTNIGPNDTLLAGHALAVDAIMVTDNLREFCRVPSLQIENWRDV